MEKKHSNKEEDGSQKKKTFEEFLETVDYDEELKDLEDLEGLSESDEISHVRCSDNDLTAKRFREFFFELHGDVAPTYFDRSYWFTDGTVMGIQETNEDWDNEATDEEAERYENNDPTVKCTFTDYVVDCVNKEPGQEFSAKALTLYYSRFDDWAEFSYVEIENEKNFLRWLSNPPAVKNTCQK